MKMKKTLAILSAITMSATVCLSSVSAMAETVETTAIRKSASLEGQLTEYGQANISSVQRNLLNKDEILRMPSSKLLGILRGNQAFMLDKVIYKEHPNAKKLKDSPITEYKSNWNKKNKSTIKPIQKKEIKVNNTYETENIFDKF